MATTQATSSGAVSTGLGTKDAAATLAVKDLRRARDFYEGTIGLKCVATEGDQVAVYQTGDSQIMVYVSQFAGTNQATAVTWVTGEDLERLVQALRDKGVQFEHYDMPGMTVNGDIHQAGDTRAAWFKDPDGNIIALVNG
jgi:catechol 2,3-dioxygenase-like lactoylglutathione lyase family enzyme